jgi:virulence factor Mce-like protein
MTRFKKISSDRGKELLGLLALVGAVGGMLLAFNGFIGRLLNGSTASHTVRAEFATVSTLSHGDPVELDGLQVGTVTNITLTPNGHGALVTMHVNNDAGPLYRDASATVAWRTVFGAEFEVDIDRGTPATGRLGSAVIPESQTTTQVELDDIASIDRGTVKQGLQALPGALGQALGDKSGLAHDAAALTDASPAITTGIGALRGLDPPTDLKTLISSTAHVVTSLDSPDNQARALVAGLAATLQTTANRSQDIQSTLALAPAALQQTETTAGILSHTLSLVNPLVAKLQPSAPRIAPVLRALQPTLSGADLLLHHADPLLRALNPAVQRLAAAAGPATSILTTLQPAFSQLDHTILPYLNQVDPTTKHTTAEMIGPTLEGYGPGAAGGQDTNGHIFRFPAVAGSGSVYLPCQIYAGDPSSKLIQCESLQQALQALMANGAPIPQQKAAR